jgi:ElaB/YqjD/DUF883 family membrane-anchored ribosome-binding protein
LHEEWETKMNQDDKTTTINRPGTARDELGQKAQDAKTVAQERGAELREQARSGLHDARTAVEERSERAKHSAADEIDKTAHGLETAADELEGSPVQQDLLREAADGLKQLSQAMHGKSLGTMVGDLSDFGRRNPLAFIGGAALAGFAMARFARASTPTHSSADQGVYGGNRGPGPRGSAYGDTGSGGSYSPAGTASTAPGHPSSTNPVDPVRSTETPFTPTTPATKGPENA